MHLFQLSFAEIRPFNDYWDDKLRLCLCNIYFKQFKDTFLMWSTLFSKMLGELVVLHICSVTVVNILLSCFQFLARPHDSYA